jgi:hypothetical protein
MSEKDDEDDEVPSREELSNAAKETGIDCLATRMLMAIGVEVLERLEDHLDDFLEGSLIAGKRLLDRDMHISGSEPFHFTDDLLAKLREEARQIVDGLIRPPTLSR